MTPAVDVFVANEQGDVPLEEIRLVELARIAASEEGVDPRAELSILLVDRYTMATLNERWLGEVGPTDVLAFPMDEGPIEEGPYLLGDVVLCPAVALEHAERSGATVVEEVELLLVHGFLHLLGYDHIRPSDAKVMRHRERKILQRFAREAGA